YHFAVHGRGPDCEREITVGHCLLICRLEHPSAVAVRDQLAKRFGNAAGEGPFEVDDRGILASKWIGQRLVGAAEPRGSGIGGVAWPQIGLVLAPECNVDRN